MIRLETLLDIRWPPHWGARCCIRYGKAQLVALPWR